MRSRTPAGAAPATVITMKAAMSNPGSLATIT